ncbi:hypothetical protein Vadar_015763 [Vaccinium darrowii]|uniref:Uncharacterized protein n=1 Tax=Vaccinium darrowii TaxID=229202 RepID=A0ACB7Y035_9ERIC|nr:hypothetical protein Vadar_015763 [Vaccinium darrowii]
MLTGSGWSFLRPYLQTRQKLVLAIGISLQIITNVSYIYVNDSGPFKKNYTYWNTAFIPLDAFGFSVVIVLTIMSIRSLKESAKADGTAARTLARMTLLRDFLVCAGMYWYLTRTMKYIIWYDDCFSGSWTDAWVETFTVIFYIAMFYLFRPKDENEYVVQDEEVSLATIHREFENI